MVINEARQTSKEQTKLPRFMLECPWLWTIFCFELINYMSYITKMFLLVSSSVSSKHLLCLVLGQGQKTEQKHTTKNFVNFHSHFFLLTMVVCKSPTTVLFRTLTQTIALYQLLIPLCSNYLLWYMHILLTVKRVHSFKYAYLSCF